MDLTFLGFTLSIDVGIFYVLAAVAMVRAGRR